jgi:hypothetical protein
MPVRARSPGPRSRHSRIGMLLDALTAIPIWVTSPFVRPWHMQWGATSQEVAADMPGDDVVKTGQFNATRAITVHAPPAAVWPWIIQLGYRRGGFYSYDLLDNAGEPSAECLLDEYQDLDVGDAIPMFRELHGLAVEYVVDSMDPPNSMLWIHRPHRGEAPDSTWSWRLAPLTGGRTRLVTRMKQDYRWHTPRLALFNLWLMEFGDFAMERKMLKAIRARAEFATDPATTGVAACTSQKRVGGARRLPPRGPRVWLAVTHRGRRDVPASAARTPAA